MLLIENCVTSHISFRNMNTSFTASTRCSLQLGIEKPCCKDEPRVGRKRDAFDGLSVLAHKFHNCFLKHLTNEIFANYASFPNHRMVQSCPRGFANFALLLRNCVHRDLFDNYLPFSNRRSLKLPTLCYFYRSFCVVIKVLLSK